MTVRKPAEMPKEEYLYDGVYASCDGFHIVLRTQREEGGYNVIYLEPRAWDDLKRYAKKIGWDE